MATYASLDDGRVELLATSNTIDNDRMLGYLRQVTRRINQIMLGRSMRPYFMPYIETRKVPINGRSVDSYHNTLLLDRPLLELTTLISGTTTITAGEGYPQGDTPYHQLYITTSGERWSTYLCDNDGNPVYAQITGLWGYHSDYANAWVAVDTLAAGINSTVATLTVADVDGDDPEGFSPRISAGNLLKVGTELLSVTATNTSTNVVTVLRHENGSPAAAHSLGDTVYRWEVEEPIKRVTARQAALLSARRGAFQVETVDGVGTISYPQDLLRELADTLQEYWYG